MATILKNNIKPGGSTLKGLVATDASGNKRDVKFVRQVNGSGTATTVYDTFKEYSYGAVTINSFSYGDIPAAGGKVTPSALTYSQVRTEVGHSGATYGTANLNSGATITYSGTGVNASTGEISATSLGATEKARTKITTVTVTVTLNGKSATKTFDVYQAANAFTGYTYDAPTGLSITCGVVPAAGGSVTSGTVSGTCSQVRRYNYTAGNDQKRDTINPTYTGSWSGGASNIGSRGTTVDTANTSTGKTLTYTYTANGKSNTATCTVYQQRNVLGTQHYKNTSGTTGDNWAYGTPTNPTLLNNLAANGGNVICQGSTVTNTKSYYLQYTSGSYSALQSESVAGTVGYEISSNGNSRFSITTNLADGDFYNMAQYSLAGTWTNTVIDGTTRQITCSAAGRGFYYGLFGKNAQRVGNTYTWKFKGRASRNSITFTSCGHECGGTKSVTLTTAWQEFEMTWKYTDGTYSAFHFYDNNCVAGDVLYLKDLTITSADKARINHSDMTTNVTTDTVGVKAYNVSDASKKSAQVTASIANAVTSTANYNGKSQACYKAVTEYQIVNFASVGDVAASGGSSYGQGTGQSRTNYSSSSYTKYEIHNVYTSGSHAHNGSYTTSSGWTDGSAPAASAWSGNTTVKGSTVSGSNLTTTVKARTKLGASSVTWNGKTASADIYQAANALGTQHYKNTSGTTGDNWTYGTPSNPTLTSKLAANGGTVTISGSTVKNTKTYYLKYTSGSYGSLITETPAGTVAYEISSNGNSRFAFASGSNTTINHSNMTTNATTDTVGVKAYNTSDSTKKSAQVTASVTNSYSDAWNAPSVSAFGYATSSFAYSGGTSAAPNSKTASQSGTRTFTSGSTSALSNSTFTWTYSTSSTGFIVNSSTGVVTAAANNGAARSGVITATATGSGSKSGTKTFTFSQVSHPTNGYEYINLNLPSGLKWAKYNVGSSDKAMTGTIFQWGSLVPYQSDVKQYYDSTVLENVEIIDSKTGSYKGTLPLAHDAARQYMGGTWRMPTYTEIRELLNNFGSLTTKRVNGAVSYYDLYIKNMGNDLFLFPSGGTLYNGAVWDSSAQVMKEVTPPVIGCGTVLRFISAGYGSIDSAGGDPKQGHQVRGVISI